MERNRCAESGCPGYCCENINIEISKSERTRLFPKAVHIRSIKKLTDIANSNIHGVYYTEYTREALERGDFYLLALNGPCPNRLPDGSCSKHEERSHAARSFSIGCTDCNAIRVEHGLAPIFIEPVE